MHSGTYEVNHDDLVNPPECSTYESVKMQILTKWLSRITPFAGGIKFDTQISPLLNLEETKLDLGLAGQSYQ